MTTNRLHPNDEPHGDDKRADDDRADEGRADKGRADENNADREETGQARLTAYALGQLDAEERASVEGELSADRKQGPQLRQEIEQTGQLADVIKNSADDAAPSPTDEQLRTTIENRLSELETAEQVERPAKRIFNRRVVFALATAVCLMLAALLFDPAFFGSLEGVTVTKMVLDDEQSAKEAEMLNANNSFELDLASISPDYDGVPRYSDATGPSNLPSSEEAQQSGDIDTIRSLDNRSSGNQKAVMERSLGRGQGRGKASTAVTQSLEFIPKSPNGTKDGQAAEESKTELQRGPQLRRRLAQKLEAATDLTIPKPEVRFNGGLKTASSESLPAASPLKGERLGKITSGRAKDPQSTRYSSSLHGKPASGKPNDLYFAQPANQSNQPAPVQGGQAGDGRSSFGTAAAKSSAGGSVDRYNYDASQGLGLPSTSRNKRRLAREGRQEDQFGIGAGMAARMGEMDMGGMGGMGMAAVQYEPIVENPFLGVYDNPLSTFSIDVDTASYANVRRFLNQGRLPPPNAVRIEEMLNYFSYDYKPPTGETPFSVHLESADCPWQSGHRLVRIGLKGKVIARKERPACNLVFLLDVSGSMSDQNKLPLLKQAMKMLAGELTENDRVSIVTYAGNAGLALDSTSGDQHEKIRTAIEQLHSGGSTNGSAGIQLAYKKATEKFLEEGTNRVILATDGDLNVGITSDNALVRLIKEKAASGVFLSVLGFGTGNLKDSKLEKLADNGNGAYNYIDNLREARKVLVEQVTGSLITIAKDVKIQIEFNPAEVKAYRLIGYENRVLQNRDFNDDKKDAGEIGAGHTVTALFELVPFNADVTPVALVAGQKLKYQRTPKPPVEKKPSADERLTEAAGTGELVSVRLRYKEPAGTKSKLVEHSLKKEKKPFGKASTDFRFAASVAAFGMALRGSEHMGSTSLEMVEEIAVRSLGEDEKGYRTEMVDLVRKASQLGR